MTTTVSVTSTIEQLVENARLSPGERSDELSEEFFGHITNLAEKAVASFKLTEQLLGEVILNTVEEVWRNLKDLDTIDPPNFSTWVGERTRRIAIQELQKLSQSYKFFGKILDPDSDVFTDHDNSRGVGAYAAFEESRAASETLEKLNLSLDELSELQRDAIKIRYHEGYIHDREACEVMGCDIDTFRELVGSAERRLRFLLTEEDFGG